MIFSHGLHELVLDGRKTQTRRVVIDGKPCRYAVGRTYAIQPARTAKGVGWLEVTAIRREAVTAITEADARAEGFDGRDGFARAWLILHGNHAERYAAGLVTHDAIATFTERFQAEDVWVIDFRLPV